MAWRRTRHERYDSTGEQYADSSLPATLSSLWDANDADLHHSIGRQRPRPSYCLLRPTYRGSKGEVPMKLHQCRLRGKHVAEKPIFGTLRLCLLPEERAEVDRIR